MNIDDIRDSDVGNKKAIDSATSKTKGFRTSFNTRINALKDSVDELNRFQDDDHVDRVRVALSESEQAHVKLENGFCYCLALLPLEENGEDSDNAVLLQEKVSLLSRDMQKARVSAYAAITSQRKAAVAERQAAAASNIPSLHQPAFQTNFNAELRPFDLSLSNTPAEYRMWKEELKSYFDSNEIHRASAPVQNNYVRKCLDRDLVSRIVNQMDTSISVAAPTTGLLALIDQTFDTQYPLLTRRLTWASCKMNQGEEPDAFLDRYNTVKKEADLDKMSADDHAVYGLLAGIDEKHSALRQKLVEKKGESYSVLEEKVRTWMATKRANKTMGESHSSPKQAAQVNTVKGTAPAQKPGQQAWSGPPLPSPPSHIKNTPRSINGKCFVCGSKDHDKYACPVKTSASCTTCRGRHLHAVCLSEYIAWKKTLPGQPQHAQHRPPGYARAVTAGSAEETKEKTD